MSELRKISAASLFCGAGGLDIGFDRAGFETVWANDFNADACETFRKWSEAEVVCGDIGKIDAKSIPDVDVLLGGFPCQGFSLSGPRKLDDSRNVLYKQYVRIVQEKMPLMFVGENVKGLLTMGGGQIIDAIIQDFSDCGYDVYYKLLNAKNFEVPEDRERVIIVGFRKDLDMGRFVFPAERRFTVSQREALKSIPEPLPGEVCEEPYSSRYMSRNRKRSWDEVAYTVTASAKQVALWPGSPDMVKIGKDEWEFGKGSVTRRLSWREAAAIQTFPADMEFSGNLKSIYKQIGNAVPCKLAEIVATHLYGLLANIA
jgi:DNA (cytosine-5)-methyltransferase 1